MDEPFQLDAERISSELKIRPDIYLRIVKSFSSTLKEKIAALEVALRSMDKETMRRILHEIKGTASNLRLVSINEAENLMHVEIKGMADPVKLAEYLSLLKKETEKFSDYINKTP
ncbi:MAG: Hpt domain-containing protein [Candidatus Omnitrophota bacterium]